MNKQIYKNKNRGYIALISTIIISTILIGLTSMVAQSSYFSRFDSLSGEYKRISKGMAESCVSLALLEIAQDPNIPSVTNKSDSSSVGCKYSISNPTVYDSEHKKVASIIAIAQYPLQNGAFSKVETNFTIYDPQFSPPSKIVVKVFSYGSGAKAAENFGPFKVSGVEVQLGQATAFNSGAYNVTQINDNDYMTSFSGDCDSSGNLILGVNDYRTCNIINTLKPQAASLTVVISNSDGTMPAHLVFDGTSHNSPIPSQKLTIPATSLYANGTTKEFSISVDSIVGYNVSKWAGSTDSDGNSLCSGNYNGGIVKLKRGDKIVCAIAFSKQIPPPDTVLMLDRTSSLADDNGPFGTYSDSDLDKERKAARSLLDYYATFTPHPQIGVGCFSDPALGTGAKIIGTLRTDYSGLYTGIDTCLSNSDNSSTDLAAAINMGAGELNSTRHITGRQKALIFISDGDPREYTNDSASKILQRSESAYDASDNAKNSDIEIYAIHFGEDLAGFSGHELLSAMATGTTTPPNTDSHNTHGHKSGSSDNYPDITTVLNSGILNPTRNTADSTTGWSIPSNAYSGDGFLATDTGNHRQRYYYFTDSSNNSLSSKIPSDSTIKGIEAYADASVTSTPTSASSTLSPSNNGNFSSWSATPSGSQKYTVTSDTNDTTYISEGIDAQTFVISNPSPAVPTGAAIDSVTLNVSARQTNGNASIQLMAEDGSGSTSHQILDDVQPLTNSFVTYSWTIPTKPDGTAWTVAEVNAWTTRFGVFKSSPSGTAQVSKVSVVVSYTTSTSSTISKYPSGTMTSPNQWTNSSRVYQSDGLYATDSTNGHQQGYSNFGFSIPSNATITGIEVTTEAKVSAASPLTTATLFPNGQGSYTSWTNGESAVDETGTPDCSSSDSIIENNSNDRESVVLDLSSIPNGSTITNVNITTYDRGDYSSGGTYKTFVNINGTNTDASTNLSATGTSGCNLKTQSINVPSTAKSSSTDLEIGVIKVSGNSNTVRVGAIRAVITYVPVNTGSIGISLSSNNGGSWTSSENVTLDINEIIDSPIGNSSSDKWGRTWVPSDFINGNFALRVANNYSTGTIVSLDQVTVNVFYTTTTSASSTLSPSNNGNFSSWSATPSGSQKYTVTSDTNDTTYISEGIDAQTFVISNPSPAVPTGAAIDSVTLNVSARQTNGNASIQLMAEDGSGSTSHQILDDVQPLTNSFVTYSWTIPTKPDGTAWTVAEVNAWTTRFGVFKSSPSGTAQVSKVSVVVSYTTSTSSTTCKLGIDLSWNNGSYGSWTSQKTQLLTGTMSTLPVFGGPIDTWGRTTWSVDDFSNTHFLVRVQDVTASGCANNTITNLDWLRSKIYYETTSPDVNSENSDDDNFYISPTADKMAEIFKVIGEEIMAPSVGQLAPVLVVVTQVNNASNTANENSSHFTISIDNPSAHSFTGSETGELLTLNVGSYNVIPTPDPDSQYTASQSSDCSDTIAAAQTKTCVIIYTANPPPPPPIEMQQNIDINSWHEIPTAS